MNVLLIEDEVLAAERLQRLLREIDPSIEVVAHLKSVAAAVQYLAVHPAPELVFLDIELGDGRCFDIFRQVKLEAPVIFTTAYDAYALQAFQANSIDYLLKPVRRSSLEQSLEKYRSVRQQFIAGYLAANLHKAETELNRQARRRNFLVKQGNRFIPVAIEEVAFFFAEGRLTFLVRWDQVKLMIAGTLEELEQATDNAAFFRVNRAFLVHRKAIVRFSLLPSRQLRIEVQPQAPREILVSKEKAQLFKNWVAGGQRGLNQAGA